MQSGFHVELNVDGKSIGEGKLLVNPEAVVFSIIDGNSGVNVNVEYAYDYRRIIMHAISRESGKPCIYAQYSEKDDDGGDDENGGGDDDDKPIDFQEIRFIPIDETKLNDIYTGMTEFSALIPNDDNDDDDADDDDDEAENIDNSNVNTNVNAMDLSGFYFGGEGQQIELSANGAAVLNRITIQEGDDDDDDDDDDKMNEDGGRFEDCDQ